MTMSRATQADRIAAYLLKKRDWVSRTELVEVLKQNRHYHLILGAANPRSIDQRKTWQGRGYAEVKSEGGRVFYRLTDEGREKLQRPSMPIGSNSPSPTSSNLGRPLGTALVQIRWDTSRESFELDFGKLRQGMKIETSEVAKDGSSASYFAICTGVSRASGEIQFELGYRRAMNKHLSKTGWLFGSSTIMAHTEGPDQWIATAIWTGEGRNGLASSCVVLSPTLVNDVTREWVERISREQQQAFRKNLLRRAAEHGSPATCEISQDSGEPALEAAHIIPAKLGGLAKSENGLLLRADLHRLYDGRLLRISPFGQIAVDPLLEATSYWKYDGARLPDRTVQRVGAALQSRAALAKKHRWL